MAENISNIIIWYGVAKEAVRDGVGLEAIHILQLNGRNHETALKELVDFLFYFKIKKPTFDT